MNRLAPLVLLVALFALPASPSAPSFPFERRPRPPRVDGPTDLRFFEGSEAVCYGPTGDGLHGVDEWVDLESIAEVATVLALLIRRLGAA